MAASMQHLRAFVAYTVSVMPYEFSHDEPELEPQAFGGRAGIPPRKFSGVGILDPPVPPKRPPSLIILGGLLLIGVIAGILFLLFGAH
jgi:hypothetical protein